MTGRGGHGWMMLICCIPMLVVAAVLVATGIASVGFLFVAIMCTAMMAMIMPRDEPPRHVVRTRRM